MGKMARLRPRVIIGISEVMGAYFINGKEGEKCFSSMAKV